MPPKNDKIIDDFGIFKNKQMKDIVEDVAILSRHLMQPDKFAQIFCDAAQTQKSIDDTLKKVLIDVIAKDVEARQAMRSVVQEVDRGYSRFLMGRLGFGLWTIATLLFGELLRYYFKF